MESPERNLQISDCEPQGSPTFSFLCTLSPIKPVRSACLAQAYSEINFQSTSYNPRKVEEEDPGSLKRDTCRYQCKNSVSATRLTQTTSLEDADGSRKDKSQGHKEKSQMASLHLNSTQKKENCDCINLDKSENAVEASVDITNQTSCCGSDKDSNLMDKNVVSEMSKVASDTPYSSSIPGRDCQKLTNINRQVSELELMMFGETHCDQHSEQDMVSNENEPQALSPTLLGLSMEEIEEYIASLKEVVKEEPLKVEAGCYSESLSNSDGECKLEADERDDQGSPSAACRVNGSVQRGTRRRCLDFNVKIESDSVAVSNKSNASALESTEQATTHGMKHAAPNVMSNTAVMPCGIGLHLNSLTRSLTFPQAVRSNSHGLGPGRGHEVASNADSLSKSEMDNHSFELHCRDGVQNSSRSVTCSINGVNQLQDDRPSGLGKRPCPLGRKRVSLPGLLKDLEVPEDQSNQTPSSPLRKKRKTSSTSEKSRDGCKRCTCKRSKCLKLYCECFAAGVYCGDSCTCQGCYNKPEYEKTVMEAREQIESRNPLAFAPKIVRTEASPIVNKEASDGTPGHVGRHKRGCNCKRSRCLKKYCECYQAGVACTEACRCECCENTFGRKSGIEKKEVQLEVLHEVTVVEENDSSDLCGQNYDTSQQQIDSLSPVTPSVEHGENRPVVHLRTASKRCLAASEELLSPLHSLSSTIICKSPNRLLRSCTKAGQRSSGLTAATPQRKSPIATPRILRIGNRWDDICTVTPLPKAPSKPTTRTSLSVVDGKECSSSVNRSQPPYLSECKTPAETVEHNVPTTPAFSSPASHVDASSGQDVDDQLLDWLEQDEDDSCTPEILKEAPVCLLNSSSPKRKRVSPPHFHCVRDQQTQAIMNHRVRPASGGIRSGRKFILQSIPTLLPVNCCPDDRDIGD